MNEHLIIDFSALGGPVYSGRKKGSLARERFKLDEIDHTAAAQVRIRIPDDTYSVTTSFFLGLFGESIKRAGTRKAFLEKFVFESPEVFSETFDTCITRALQEQSSLVKSNKIG